MSKRDIREVGFVIHDVPAFKDMKKHLKNGELSAAWDVDDTLVPTASGNHDSIKRLIGKYFDPIHGAWKSDFGADAPVEGSVTPVFNAHGIIVNFPYLVFAAYQRGDEVLRKTLSACYDKADYSCVVALGSNLAVEALHEAGVNQFIYSSGPNEPHINRVLAETGLDRFFGPHNAFDIISSCKLVPDTITADLSRFHGQEALAPYFKPTQSGFAFACAARQADPDKTIFLEDSLHNALASRFGIWVNRYPENIKIEDGHAKPMATLTALRHLPKLLAARPR